MASPPEPGPGTKEVFNRHLLHGQNSFEVKVHMSHIKKEAELLADWLVLCTDGAQLMGEKNSKGKMWMF